MTLLDQTRHVLALAAKQAFDTPLAGSIAEARDRLDDPLRVAVAGRVKAGKSTLVNAMVGELIAPTDAQECTRVVTWYRDGVTYRVAGVAVDGSRAPLRFDRDGGALHVELGTASPDELSSIEVEWPSARLREMTIVDTPGIDSITDGLSARAERFLVGSNERPTPTDAVLYLLRHVHSADIGFLESFHDDDMAAANPVNSIGVLSRADEIGAARPDAMSSAQRIAHRWAGDRRLARLVQAVVPVAGLLAEAASTLRQAEFEVFVALARADRQLVDELLVSADRFARSSAPVGVIDAERAAVLDRFGLFGCRVALAAVRGDHRPPVVTAGGLADCLLAESGLPALRAEIALRFTTRRDLLKARQGLAAARHAAIALGDDALAAEVERITDGAHEFAELRVLNALRTGAVRFDERRTHAALTLLAESAIDIRLGLDGGADDTEIRLAATEHLSMWQSQAEHPLATPDVAAAARVLTRTCEALLAASTAP